MIIIMSESVRQKPGSHRAAGSPQRTVHDVELPSRKSGLGASKNDCVLTMLVLRTSEQIIVWQKERFCSVPAPGLRIVWPDTLVGCLNSIFPKFHSKEELSEFEFLGGEPAQELSFEISIFKITFPFVLKF